MFHMRPGTRIPAGMRSFKNLPAVEPPGLLRLVAALSMLSVIGTAVYSVLVTLAMNSSTTVNAATAMVIAMLHFLLPLGVVYTVFTNHRLSRILLATHILALYASTLLGIGLPGLIFEKSLLRDVLATFLLVISGIWLFASHRMRFYYARLSGDGMPSELAERAHVLAREHWISVRASGALEWIADRLEILVLFGMIVVAVYACMSV